MFSPFVCLVTDDFPCEWNEYLTNGLSETILRAPTLLLTKRPVESKFFSSTCCRLKMFLEPLFEKHQEHLGMITFNSSNAFKSNAIKSLNYSHVRVYSLVSISI
jgi:hypothetical protein